MHWLLTDRSSDSGYAIATEAVDLAVASGDLISEVRARLSRATILVTGGEEQEGLAEVERTLGRLEDVKNPIVVLRVYHGLITAVMASRRVRREMPRKIVGRMRTVAGSDERLVQAGASWVVYVYLQHGEWDEASRLLEVNAAVEHLEAMDKLSLLIPRMTLQWMRGDLDSAHVDVRAAEDVGVNPRWYHDFLATKAEIATDRGDLDEVRGAAQFYLAFEVDSSEAAKKLGTLHPLVRAEVEAALAATGAQRADHERRAREALATMRRILEDHPAPHSGSFMCETHDTHLTLQPPEVSRVAASDPALWRQAYEEADYVYYRLYAQMRLGEALAGNGDRAEGERHLREALVEASRLGAEHLAERVRHIAVAYPLDV